MVDKRRELHLLVPDHDRRRCLVTREGSLPVRVVPIAERQTTVGAAAATAAEVLGIAIPIVEVHFDYERDPDAGPVPTLVVTESFGTAPPAGLAWLHIEDRTPATNGGLTARLHELVTEWRTGAEPPPLRPRWSRPGWHARATDWLLRELAAIGRPSTGPIEQIRHWGISALMRVPTAAGAAWFKAVFPPFHHEPAVTLLLAQRFEAVPRVLASEPDEGWLVTDDVGPETADEADDETQAKSAAALVAIQRAMTPETRALRELGCPRRDLATLVSELAAILDERPPLPGVPPDVDRAALLGRVERAVAAVEALGIPDSLIHGDFHGGNVATTGGRPVVFDWSDAAIGNPLVDVVTWPGPWLEPEVQRPAQLGMLGAWQDAVGAGTALRERHDDIVTVGAAYQVVSYAGITRNLEPLRRLELADGIETFLRIAVGGIDAAGSLPTTPAVTPDPGGSPPATSA